MMRSPHQHGHHHHAHGKGHGHHHDRSLGGALRYLRLLPRMWRSDVNEEVVRALAIRPGEQGLDLGAGAGAATMEAVRLGARVIAVDPMPLMQAVLGLRNLLQPHRDRLQIRPGAAEAIPAEDGSIDALWTVNTLHHWTDREAAAREIARILRPGGRVLLLDEVFDDPSHPEHDPARIERHRRFHFDDVDPEELASSLRRAGFAAAVATRTRFAGRPVKLIRGTR